MSKVHHPRIPNVSYDVPDNQVDAWKAQGWVTTPPTRRPRRKAAPAKKSAVKKKASSTPKENDDA